MAQLGVVARVNGNDFQVNYEHLLIINLKVLFTIIFTNILKPNSYFSRYLYNMKGNIDLVSLNTYNTYYVQDPL